MKRSVTLTVVLLLASLGILATFAEGQGVISRQVRPRPPEQPQVNPENPFEEPGLPETPGIVRPRTEPDPLADPNKVRARVKAVEGLEKVLMELDRQSQNEMREWLQVTTDNRINQVRAVERQVKAEMDAIRKIAVEEKAAKTVAAIDGLELSRLERMRKLLKNIQDEAKSIRQPRGTRIRGRELPTEGTAVQGQGYGQDVNQPGLRLRRR
jgi:hypothetical protein